MLSNSTDGNFSDEELEFNDATGARWAEGEKFNIMHAFQQQVNRIRAEWDDYLESMNREFVVEKAKIEGTDPQKALRDIQRIRRSDQGHWLSKEKQETLVHTAPVLSPNAVGMGGGFGDASSPSASRSRGLSASARRRLTELEQRYEDAKAQVTIQQSEAIRWVHRQRNRMVLQVEAQEIERASRHKHQLEEQAASNRLYDQLHELSQALINEITQKATPGVVVKLHLDGPAEAEALHATAAEQSHVSISSPVGAALGLRIETRSTPKSKSSRQSQGQSHHQSNASGIHNLPDSGLQGVGLHSGPPRPTAPSFDSGANVGTPKTPKTPRTPSRGPSSRRPQAQHRGNKQLLESLTPRASASSTGSRPGSRSQRTASRSKSRARSRTTTPRNTPPAGSGSAFAKRQPRTPSALKHTVV